MEITYRIASIEELDFLVSLRVKELALFSDVPIEKDVIEQTRKFYQKKMETNECFTILGYDKDTLVTTGSLYFYEAMPSNANHMGITGYITNIWTSESYRGQGLAGNILDLLLELSKDKCGLVCLNAVIKAIPLYQRKGFILSDKNMVYTWNK